jgi:WD40 repeat protein
LLYLREKHDEVNALDISPDGRTVAIAFNNGTIECTQLERTEDGQFQLSEETWTLAAHSGKVKSIKFAGPTELVSCGADGQIKSWQLTDARPLCIGRSETYGLAISPASNEIAFADDQGWNLMNPTDGSKRSQGHFPYAAGSLIAFSRDGRFLAGITSDNRVAVYRQDDGEILQEFTASGRPTDVQFSPVANELATISANILNVWDLETMSSIAELQLYPSATGPESNCGYTTDGKFILAAGTFGELLVIDAFSFTIVRRIPIASNTNAIAFSPAGDILATAHDDGGIRIWDWPRGMIRATLIGHTQKVRRIAFSSDGRTLASIAFDKTTRLWAPKIGRYYGILHHHFAIPTDLAFATNGTFLAVTQERSKSTGGGLLIFPTTSDPSDIKF